MSPVLLLALGFAAVIAGGTVAVAVNDAVERWWERASDPGFGAGLPVTGVTVRTVAVSTRRPAATVRVGERRPTPERSPVHPSTARRRPH